MNTKEYDKNYYQKNKERRKEQSNEWYKKNREKKLEKCKEWHKNNPKKIKKYQKTYYQNNCEKIKEKIKQWQKNNHEKIRDKEREYKNKKRKINPKYNLNYKILILINKCLKGNKNGKNLEDLVGYRLIDLKEQLKGTIPKGYTWQNYLDGKLQIDHRIPISVFNFTKPEHIDFKRCWALENLRLLPAKENLIKSSKLTKPFQPALRI